MRVGWTLVPQALFVIKKLIVELAKSTALISLLLVLFDLLYFQALPATGLRDFMFVLHSL